MSFASGRSGLRLEQENIRLAAENDRLARTIDRLQHDPEYIQDRIRQELNFVKNNEIIFQFPPEKPGTAPNLTATANGETPPPTRVQAISARKVGSREVGLRTSGRVFSKEAPAAAGSEPSPVTASLKLVWGDFSGT